MKVIYNPSQFSLAFCELFRASPRPQSDDLVRVEFAGSCVDLLGLIQSDATDEDVVRAFAHRLPLEGNDGDGLDLYVNSHGGPTPRRQIRWRDHIPILRVAQEATPIHPHLGDLDVEQQAAFLTMRLAYFDLWMETEMETSNDTGGRLWGELNDAAHARMAASVKKNSRVPERTLTRYRAFLAAHEAFVALPWRVE